MLLAAGLIAWGGAPALFWGYFASTVLLWHCTFFINSLAHVLGRRRYETGDESRNSFLLAVMPQGQAEVVGKDASRPLYEAVLKEYDFTSESTLQDVEASGDLGYFRVTYKLTAIPKAGGESFAEEGKSLFIVKRQAGGAWKITRLIDNSSRGPAGPSA